MARWKEGATLLLALPVLLSLPAEARTHGPGQTQHDHERLQNITLAVILPENNTRYPWAWPRIGPAVDRAVRNINADPTLLPNHRLVYFFKNSQDKNGMCSESVAPLMAVDLKLAYNPWAFIGPGCSYSSSPVGLFTTHWSVPMVTAGAPAVAFSSGTYLSITNTGPTHKKLGRFAVRICEHFGWREQVMVVFSDNKKDDRPCYFAIEGLYMELSNINISVEESVFVEESVTYAQVLSKIQDNGRVVFVCCSPDVFRKLMVEFRRENLTHEQYVFFYLDVFADSLKSEHRQPWRRGDREDAIAKEAFQSVKILTYREPQNAEYHRSSIFSPRTALTFRRGIRFTCVPVCFSSGVTGLLHLDESGDRETDFALWDIVDTNSTTFQIAMVYSTTEEHLTAIPGTHLYWLGGAPPPDFPVCGFKNDNQVCLAKTITIYQMVSIVVVFFFILILTIAIFIYRRMKLEKELVAQLWRISWDDIQMSDLNKVLRSGSKLTLSLRGSNYGSLMTGDGNLQIFAKTGYHKGNIVAIKYINKKRIELNRKVLFELKHMRDVQNEHLTRFIGACIDPPNCCIVTEYCSRGSLQDILENDSITLDWMFKYSLINDIVKGMLFLHNSVIFSHGKLKSSNCVVDNRFVLKITDYGLSSFRSESDAASDAHAYYAQKLWMAPELLRMERPPPQGTQKGDVYSFGIILQEVALRRGAFYLEGDPLSPKEIVDRVILGEWPCLRPTIDPQSDRPELGQLMERCWAEEPTERPEFNQIRVLLRKQNNCLAVWSPCEGCAPSARVREAIQRSRGAHGHFLWAEPPAHTLMAPYCLSVSSVAEQLKRGETVQAEAFDSVTIYFSDIVGFTTISAESTPMEVVTLLNDLYTCFDAIIDNFDVYKVNARFFPPTCSWVNSEQQGASFIAVEFVSPDFVRYPDGTNTSDRSEGRRSRSSLNYSVPQISSVRKKRSKFQKHRCFYHTVVRSELFASLQPGAPDSYSTEDASEKR
uniref:guanylate cyclase n=1 Tax=Neolamprologus brichardi TaxID=32507 RepID=A0A3Q4MHY9_NEOBR